MTFSKGSLILVDYTAKVKDTNEVFETTIEEEAKKHSIHDPNIKYQPKLVSVGESWVIKGLDEALVNTNSGDTPTVEVT
ncbi:MAG: FKBP-type peptidyl-prolyl cis-trans isomerase, partial [Nitrosopumilaceae archaeon]